MTEQLGFDFGDSKEKTEGPGPDDARPPDPVDEAAPTATPSAKLISGPGAPQGEPCRVVQELARAARIDRFGRKVLLARTRGEGRELLRQLAVREGAWVGFEVQTVHPVAVELAGSALARDGVGVVDEFQRQAFLDRAIDDVLVSAGPGPLSRLAEGVGFRAALQSSVLTLRMAGIPPERVQSVRFDDRAKQRVIAAIQARYETHLAEAGLTDEAGVVARAVDLLETTSPDERLALLGARELLIVPGLSSRGLSGRIVRSLLQGGARLLPADPVRGLKPPEGILWSEAEPSSPLSWLHVPEALEAPADAVSVFSAASMTDELREVLRRASAAGLAWDQVEIVAADATAYGSAMHALTETLEIPVSFAVGLPVHRTRPGRAVTAYFRWLDSGFGAEVVLALLEAGDLVPPRPWSRILPSRLARRFRSLRIGWGRERYLARIEQALEALEELGPGRRESADGFQKRLSRRRAELEALRAILAPVLRVTPRVPGRVDPSPEPVSPALLARGLRAFLRWVPVTNAVDRTAAERLVRRLDRITATLTRKTDYRAAAAILLGYLDFRVPAPRAEGKAPWSSAGGHVYLSDIEHGGQTGRAATFVVGLDAGRIPGQGHQDPLLLDTERAALGRDLAGGKDRAEERVFAFAALLARLRGQVTLSYSSWDPAEARTVAPSPELLQAFRVACGRPTATFRDLHEHLGTAVGLIPPPGPHLDARDVWLSSLSRDGRLLAGGDVVRAVFPNLSAGLRARDAIHESAATAYHGRVEARPETFDPRRNESRVLSASALETLGRCPRKYLYQYVLGIRPPDDPELDPDRWLDSLRKGSLLHRVYERVLSQARDDELGLDEVERLAQDVLSEEAKRVAAEVPAPSEAIRLKEMEQLARDIRAFVEAVGPFVDDWVALELTFGLGGDEPVALPVGQATIHVRGAIDRVDRRPEGLVVVDYKTGNPKRYGPKTGVYDGGRRLQHFVYTRVAGQLYGEEVRRMEYSFPTHSSQGQRRGYAPTQLRTGGLLISAMLDGIGQGWFMPTDEPADCTWCDYGRLCAVRSGDRACPSPFAAWSAEHRDDLEELSALRRARRWDEEGDGFWAAM
jgi:ATP-dependent helicase/nuclease subunit B